jgi:hypothetical protein
MTSAQIISEIKRLPAADQTEVLDFALRLAEERRLPGAELALLATQLVDADSPAAASQVREKLRRGFYGADPHGTR